jgi:hypothetical protein
MTNGDGVAATTRRIVAAIWLGSGVFAVLAASAAFRSAGDPFAAANVVGAILTRWHYIALIAPLLLLFLDWRGQRGLMVVVLFVAILLGALESMIDVRIAAMRRRSIVPISSLSRGDPVRRQFGMLHGISTLLLLADIAAAAVAVALEPRRSDRGPTG